MYQSQCLTEQRKGVLEDLFFSTMTVREVLEKRHVDCSEYCKWFAEESFNLEFRKMLELFRLESKLALARYSSQVAMKMVSLALDEDNEIARHACIDVINHPDFKKAEADAKPDKEEEPPEIPPELASKWLNDLSNYRDSCKEPKQTNSP